MALQILRKLKCKIVLVVINALHGFSTFLANSFRSLTMDPGNASKTGKRCAEDCGNDTGAKHARPCSWTDETTFPINDLPESVLIHIFKQFTLKERLQMSLVCKFWYSLANDQDMWQKLNVRDMQNVDDAVLLRLTSLSKNVTHLDISGLQSLTSEGFVAMLQQCRNLLALKAYSCSSKLDEQALAAVGKYCHQLHYLSYDSCEHVSDLVLEAIAQGCPQLQTLRIGGASKVTSDGICVIAKHCPRLNYLNLDECRTVNDDCLEALTACCPDMESLCLNNTRVTHNKLLLLGRFKKLNVLEISRINNLTEEGLVNVVCRCPSLTNLSINLCDKVTDVVVEAISRKIPNVTKLCLVNCCITDKALFHLGDYSHKLESLDVSWCSALSDVGARYVSEKCPRLSYLSLMRCDSVSDATVEELVKLFPRIYYSTMYLDYGRLLAQAHKAGVLSKPIKLHD